MMSAQLACASTGRLREYYFRDRTAAVVAVIPLRPYVDTGDPLDLTGLDPFGATLKVGTSIYKESQTGKLRARFDSASASMDLANRIVGGVLERPARYLVADAGLAPRSA